MGEGCADLKKAAISEVSGENWHGWVAENVYSFAKKQADSGCEGINSNHRCIGILIGNKTMSAAMIGYCFLRESDQPLEGDDMEYDLFMSTIKNLRFKEN